MATAPPKTTKQTTKQPRTSAARPKQPQPPTKIRILSGDLYWVSSQSHPGQGHHTTPHSCTCPAGKVGRLCRHVKIVRVYHAWRMQQQHAWRMEQVAARVAAPAPQQTPAVEMPQGTGTTELRPLSRHFE